MDKENRHPRRWLRFSLRFLVVVVLVCSIGFAWFFYALKRAQDRRLAAERFDWDGNVSRMEEVYRRVLTGQQPASVGQQRVLRSHYA